MHNSFVKLLPTILLSLAFRLAPGQECKTYYLLSQGTEVELTLYDKKGEANGRNVSKVTEVKSVTGGYEANISVTTYNGRGKEQINNPNVAVSCQNGVYAVDLRNLVPAEAMAGQKDVQVRVEGNMAEYPARLEPGQTLKDATMTAEPTSGGMALMRMTVTLKNRKVEGKETITTPAGSYDCFKITYDANVKTIVGFNFQAAEWFAPGFGVVKTETFRNGKTVGSTLITKVTKGS